MGVPSSPDQSLPAQFLPEMGFAIPTVVLDSHLQLFSPYLVAFVTDRYGWDALFRLFVIVALAVLWPAPPACVAQTQTKPYLSSPRRALTAPELLEAPEEWIERSLKWANDILDNYPPALIEHPVRRAALTRLDDILHIESAPRKALVQEFYRARMEKAVREIEQTRVAEGTRIWKLYNHGFFVRTPTVSFTFDIVPGTATPGFAVDTKVLDRLADQSDATFISHLHGDHANQTVAKLFLARNKPVVAVEGLWAKDAELSRSLTYLKRSTTVVHEVSIQNGRRMRLPRQVYLDIGYVGAKGTRIASMYHALRVKLERRISPGLSILGAYTWSKTLTNADTSGNLGSGAYNGNNQNYLNRHDGRSYAVFDIRL